MRRRNAAAVGVGVLAVVVCGLLWRSSAIQDLLPGMVGSQRSAVVFRPVPAPRVTRVLTAATLVRRADSRDTEILADLSEYQRHYVTEPLAVLQRIRQHAESDGDAALVARVISERKKLLDQASDLPEPDVGELQR